MRNISIRRLLLSTRDYMGDTIQSNNITYKALGKWWHAYHPHPPVNFFFPTVSVLVQSDNLYIFLAKLYFLTFWFMSLFYFKDSNCLSVVSVTSMFGSLSLCFQFCFWYFLDLYNDLGMWGVSIFMFSDFSIHA